ncbi:MAG: hypothetical protein IJA12_00905, partial [Oscillospiraceae bacterium]|nr:hypothetical protein [Oscillospiraceae bacterium]
MKSGLGVVTAAIFRTVNAFVPTGKPFTAEAVTSSVGLEMNSPKTSYSLDEIKKGATATVY